MRSGFQYYSGVCSEWVSVRKNACFGNANLHIFFFFAKFFCKKINVRAHFTRTCAHSQKKSSSSSPNSSQMNFTAFGGSNRWVRFTPISFIFSSCCANHLVKVLTLMAAAFAISDFVRLFITKYLLNSIPQRYKKILRYASKYIRD